MSLQRLFVPEIIAKQEASISFGHIFANMTSMGMKRKACSNTSDIISRHTTNHISGTPHFKFTLKTRAKLKGERSRVSIVAHMMLVLTSLSLRKARKINVPSKMHTKLKRVNMASMNCEMPSVSVIKK